MSAYMTVSGGDDSQPAVYYYPDGPGTRSEPLVSIRVGLGSLQLDPDSARKLADDIIAALSGPVTA